MSGTANDKSKSNAAKALKKEAEEYTGPIEFEYKGEVYKSIASGDCAELYDFAEMLQEDRIFPALKAVLDTESYQKYRATKPKPSDVMEMLKAFGKAAGANVGESAG